MGRATKGPIVRGEYKEPTPDGWAGWIEDKAKTWIMFYTLTGAALFYPKREANGAVIGEGIPSVITDKPDSSKPAGKKSGA